jgi:prevent-host-death family protein
MNKGLHPTGMVLSKHRKDNRSAATPVANFTGPGLPVPPACIATMTTYGHNKVMTIAKVSELKAKLSAYLSEVRKGGSVTVYDRKTPIARIVPFLEESDDLLIVEATAPPSDLKKIKGVRPKKRINIDKLLRDSRGDR